MAQLINEIKRMQFLAGVINENAQHQLSSKEQKIVDNILNAGSLEEGEFNLKAILDRMVQMGKKGLLTLSIISAVLSSCNVEPKDMMQIDRDNWNTAVELAKQDSASAAQQGKTISVDSSAFAHKDSMDSRFDQMQNN